MNTTSKHKAHETRAQKWCCKQASERRCESQFSLLANALCWKFTTKFCICVEWSMSATVKGTCNDENNKCWTLTQVTNMERCPSQLKYSACMRQFMWPCDAPCLSARILHEHAAETASTSKGCMRLQGTRDKNALKSDPNVHALIWNFSKGAS